MHSKILTLLVVTINQRLRNAKAALETEEKAREIATLQGSICGWKKLLDLITDSFGPNIPFMEDSNEPAPVIESMEFGQLKKLHTEMEDLVKNPLWKILQKRVAENKEELKEMLITTADCARDLHLAQAQQSGLTAYDPLFTSLKDEFERRGEELDFDAVPYEEPTEEPPLENGITYETLALPPPKKPRRKKGEE
jgi:hypothetical protein